jgi:hypothetical protein
MTATSGDDRSISVAQRRCAAACVACRDACLAAVAYCLETRGDPEDAAHVRLLRECAEQCDRAVPVLRQTADGGSTMATVVEVAGRVTRELIRQFPDDAQLQACAQTCHECATGCSDAVASPMPQDELVDESVDETFPASDPPAR